MHFHFLDTSDIDAHITGLTSQVAEAVEEMLAEDDDSIQ